MLIIHVVTALPSLATERFDYVSLMADWEELRENLIDLTFIEVSLHTPSVPPKEFDFPSVRRREGQVANVMKTG